MAQCVMTAIIPRNKLFIHQTILIKFIAKKKPAKLYLQKKGKQKLFKKTSEKYKTSLKQEPEVLARFRCNTCV